MDLAILIFKYLKIQFFRNIYIMEYLDTFKFIHLKKIFIYFV